jgi:hypothetical protein
MAPVRRHGADPLGAAPGNDRKGEQQRRRGAAPDQIL